MKVFITQFEAIDRISAELSVFAGENIMSESWDEAQEWCDKFKSHLVVIGELGEVAAAVSPV